jgi:hypothetical protein
MFLSQLLACETAAPILPIALYPTTHGVGCISPPRIETDFCLWRMLMNSVD